MPAPTLTTDCDDLPGWQAPLGGVTDDDNVVRLPTAQRRRGAHVPDAAARLLGAADDLTEIAAEHQYDRDGIREIAARLRRVAAELGEP